MADWPAKKSAAFNLQFPIFDADGDLVTAAASLDSEVSKDGGTFTDCTNEAAEIATSSGMYRLVLTSAEMGADEVAVITKTGTAGAKTAPNVIYTAARQLVDLAYPTVSGRSLDVSAGGEAGLDWANVGSPTTTVGLSGTTVKTATDVETDTADIQTRLPAALVSGRMDSSVGAIVDGVIPGIVTGTSDSGSTTTMVDAARTEADTDYWKDAIIQFTSGNIAGQSRLITDFNAATDTITFAPATTQAVATQNYRIIPAGRVDVNHWLGSVVNALVSGRVDSSVGAMASGVLTATAIAADAITAAKLAADVTTELQAGLATSAALATVQSDTDDIQTRLPAALVSGRMDSDVQAMANAVITAAKFAAGAIDANALAADAVDEIWDEASSGHTTAGTFGNVLRLHNAGMFIQGAVNDAGATTTDFDTNGFTEASNDHFNGHWIVFITGALKGQARRVRDYVGSGQNMIFDRPWTEAPANTDQFLILGTQAGAEEFLLARLADVEADADTTVRRVIWAMAKLINKVDASTTTVAIKKTDDATNQFTQTATETPGANPITVLDTV
jgi:hypothetical protein